MHETAVRQAAKAAMSGLDCTRRIYELKSRKPGILFTAASRFMKSEAPDAVPSHRVYKHTHTHTQKGKKEETQPYGSGLRTCGEDSVRMRLASSASS